MSRPRGIRNNNPGNIEVGDPWQGLMPRDQMDEEQKKEDRFCVFSAPEWGIRAICRVLISYQDKHGIRTVRGMISRWAPPTENKTNVYVDVVAKAAGVDPDAEVSVYEYKIIRPLVEAIIKHENGMQPYSSAIIDKGIILAGVEPNGRRVVSNNVDNAKTIGTVTGAIAVAATAVEQAAPAVAKVDEFATNYTVGFVIVVAILAAVGIYFFIKRRKKVE